jgi:hypothetical protein
MALWIEGNAPDREMQKEKRRRKGIFHTPFLSCRQQD